MPYREDVNIIYGINVISIVAIESSLRCFPVLLPSSGNSSYLHKPPDSSYQPLRNND